MKHYRKATDWFSHTNLYNVYFILFLFCKNKISSSNELKEGSDFLFFYEMVTLFVYNLGVLWFKICRDKFNIQSLMLRLYEF